MYNHFFEQDLFLCLPWYKMLKGANFNINKSENILNSKHSVEIPYFWLTLTDRTDKNTFNMIFQTLSP